MALGPATRTLSYRPAPSEQCKELPRQSEQHSGDEWVGVDMQVRGTTKKRQGVCYGGGSGLALTALS